MSRWGDGPISVLAVWQWHVNQGMLYIQALNHQTAVVCRLRDAIQNAADQAVASTGSSSSAPATGTDRERGPSAKHLKPIVTAVEMVFGSAAALSATFGFKDRIGIDVELLDQMQRDILNLYKTGVTSPSTVSPTQTNLDAIQDSINGLCSASIQSALYKAAGQLLDDLHRNVRLLGTPERYSFVMDLAKLAQGAVDQKGSCNFTLVLHAVQNLTTQK